MFQIQPLPCLNNKNLFEPVFLGVDGFLYYQEPFMNRLNETEPETFVAFGVLLGF
jgi:hypothetical protein